MSRRIRHHRPARIAALALGCCALMAPASASAASKIGDTPADFPGAVVTRAVHIGDTPADFPGAVVTRALHIGDTPADFPRSVTRAVRIGDTPADFPGASGAPARISAPATVSDDTGGVDVPQVLAIGLLAALTLALGTAVALARTQDGRRRLAGRLH